MITHLLVPRIRSHWMSFLCSLGRAPRAKRIHSGEIFFRKVHRDYIGHTGRLSPDIWKLRIVRGKKKGTTELELGQSLAIARLKPCKELLNDLALWRAVRIRDFEILAVPGCEVLHTPGPTSKKPEHCEIRGERNNEESTHWALLRASRKVHYPENWRRRNPCSTL